MKLTVAIAVIQASVALASVVWDSTGITRLLTDAGESQIDQLAEKYNVYVKVPTFLEEDAWQPIRDTIATKFQSLVQQLPAVNTLQQSFLDIYEDEEPLTFELDATTIAKLFNESLQAAVQPLVEYAALTNTDPAPSFAELQHARFSLSC